MSSAAARPEANRRRGPAEASWAPIGAYAARALAGHRLRTALNMLGIAVGIASVILLTSIGEGTRRFVFDQFSQFGTNIIAINPGKSETLGIPGVLGGTTHKLTLDDALAIERLSSVTDLVPVAFGSARVEARGRGRAVYVYGVTPNVPELWKFAVRQGSFWSAGDPRQGGYTAVLGTTLKRELFGAENALGELVRIGGTRFRVIGIMEPKGRLLGIDIDDSVYVPVATAMNLLNRTELDEIDIQFHAGETTDRVVASVKALLTERHRGREDFTITTQEEMLRVFDRVMKTITAAVGAIAGISLLVGAIGILTTMWIAVGERTGEIGLLRAVGVRRHQIRILFLTESGAMALAGGVAGLTVGLGLCALLRAAIPGLPVATPLGFAVAALAVSVATGLVAGVLPSQRAAKLDPIQALRQE